MEVRQVLLRYSAHWYDTVDVAATNTKYHDSSTANYTTAAGQIIFQWGWLDFPQSNQIPSACNTTKVSVEIISYIHCR